MSSKSNHSELPATYVEGWSDLESICKIPYRQLGQTDMKVSLLTFGAAHVSALPTVKVHLDGSITGADESEKALCEAVRLGINLIDTSPFYGQGLSETIVGQALRSLPRKSYYIATKVGRHPNCTFDYSASAIRRSVEQSLFKLGVEYIDLLQIHDVEFGDIETILSESLPTLAELQEQHKIRYIGITGYPLEVLKKIVERSKVKIDTILSYCRFTLFDAELTNYLPFFESKHLGVISASPFGMGLYNLKNPIPYWHPAPKEIKDACQQAAQLAQEHGFNINRLALLHSISEPGIHTHLIGMETTHMARLNVLTISAPHFTEEEHQFVQRLHTEIFSCLNVHNWEDKELQRYRRDPQEFTRFLQSGGKRKYSGSKSIKRTEHSTPD